MLNYSLSEYYDSYPQGLSGPFLLLAKSLSNSLVRA